MTYLDLVNAVLRRLRQDEVMRVPDSAYAKLIGDFVNSTKREVEDSFRWSHLRYTQTETTLPLTGLEDIVFLATLFGASFTANRMRIEAVKNVDSNIWMRQLTQEQWRRQVETGATVTGAPDRWRIFGYGLRSLNLGTDVQGPMMQVYPTPTAVTNISITAYVAQIDLSADDDVLRVPYEPVVLGAYSRAVSERGEDGGASFDETQRDYQSALNDAIAMDNQMRGGGYETDWVIE